MRDGQCVTGQLPFWERALPVCVLHWTVCYARRRRLAYYHSPRTFAPDRAGRCHSHVRHIRAGACAENALDVLHHTLSTQLATPPQHPAYSAPAAGCRLTHTE